MKKPAKRAHVKPHKRAKPKKTAAHKKPVKATHTVKHPKPKKRAAARPKRKVGKAKATAVLASGHRYDPDTPDPRDHIYKPRQHAAPPVDLSPHMPPVWDQGDDEDCVAYAALAVLLHAVPDAPPVLPPDGPTGEIRETVKASATRFGLEYLRVTPDDLAACLSDGHPVMFGITYTSETGDVLGPHCMVAVGHDTKHVKVRNSWGDEHILIPLDYLQRHGADFWTIVPG